MNVYFFQSYKEFHEDLFPDTPCGEPALSSEDWFSGQNGQVWYYTHSFNISYKQL